MRSYIAAFDIGTQIEEIPVRKPLRKARSPGSKSSRAGLVGFLREPPRLPYRDIDGSLSFTSEPGPAKATSRTTSTGAATWRAIRCAARARDQDQAAMAARLDRNRQLLSKKALPPGTSVRLCCVARSLAATGGPRPSEELSIADPSNAAAMRHKEQNKTMRGGRKCEIGSKDRSLRLLVARNITMLALCLYPSALFATNGTGKVLRCRTGCAHRRLHRWPAGKHISVSDSDGKIASDRRGGLSRASRNGHSAISMQSPPAISSWQADGGRGVRNAIDAGRILLPRTLGLCLAS
jgi:hypothetical protein